MIVLSSNALKGTLEKSRAELERAVGMLELHFDATQAILPRLAQGLRGDLVILTAEAMDDLHAKGKVSGVRALGSSGVGLAVRAGAPRPDIGTVDALRRTLAAASSVAYSRFGASGIHFAQVVEQLKVPLKKRMVLEKGLVGTLVAAGEAELGAQMLCELEPVPGIDIVGPLPAPVQKVTHFAAGVLAGAADAAGAATLARLLKL